MEIDFKKYDVYQFGLLMVMLNGALEKKTFVEKDIRIWIE
jgi:hypothetical protein